MTDEEIDWDAIPFGDPRHEPHDAQAEAEAQAMEATRSVEPSPEVMGPDLLPPDEETEIGRYWDVLVADDAPTWTVVGYDGTNPDVPAGVAISVSTVEAGPERLPDPLHMIRALIAANAYAHGEAP